MFQIHHQSLSNHTETTHRNVGNDAFLNVVEGDVIVTKGRWYQMIDLTHSD